jgi:hypothetical protein
MKTRLLSIIALACGLAMTGAYAAEAVAEGASAPKKATKTEKAAAKEKRKAASHGKTAGAEATQDKPMASASAPAVRKAERVEKRTELKAANKAGELPKTNEAGPVASAPKK